MKHVVTILTAKGLTRILGCHETREAAEAARQEINARLIAAPWAEIVTTPCQCPTCAGDAVTLAALKVLVASFGDCDDQSVINQARAAIAQAARQKPAAFLLASGTAACSRKYAAMHLGRWRMAKLRIVISRRDDGTRAYWCADQDQTIVVKAGEQS